MEIVQGLLGPGAEAVSFIASFKEITQYLVEYEKGESFPSVAGLIERVKIYLAGKASKEKNSEVKLVNLDINGPDFDGIAFSQEYARSVK